jgi:hypothetical protein
MWTLAPGAQLTMSTPGNHSIGFIAMGTAGAASALVVLVLLPETKPIKYTDR